MTRVYVDMVADLFHWGHVEFLRRSRELGDELVVGVHADSDVEAYKRRPILTMDERIRVVSACRYVDEVIARAPLVVDHAFVELHRIDVVAHGDDFSPEQLERFYRAPVELGILRTVPYTAGISTSDILERLRGHVDGRAANEGGR